MQAQVGSGAPKVRITAGVPKCNSFRTRPGRAEPEVVFRIVHVALANGSPTNEGTPSPSHREQVVEVALGPNPTFRPQGADALTRRVPVSQVINAVPPSRRKACPPRLAKPVGPPCIVETLRKALEWRRQLDAGKVPNQAAIARREGISRARVTQILCLLRLPSETLNRILTMRSRDNSLDTSEHALRRMVLALRERSVARLE